MENITQKILVDSLVRAKFAGTIAANCMAIELFTNKDSDGELLEACRRSILTLSVDGRSRFGRLLAKIESEGIEINKYTKGIEINKADNGGYSVRLPYDIKLPRPLTSQEQPIRYVADSAAAELIEKDLGIKANASNDDS